jgi:hypothetical protein
MKASIDSVPYPVRSVGFHFTGTHFRSCEVNGFDDDRTVITVSPSAGRLNFDRNISAFF